MFLAFSGLGLGRYHIHPHNHPTRLVYHMGYAYLIDREGISFYRCDIASSPQKDHGNPSDAFYTLVSYGLGLGAYRPMFSGYLVEDSGLNLL